MILGLVGAQAAAGALASPARKAFIPRLLPKDQVAAGIALSHLSFQAAMLAGPALAGVAAAEWGVTACYLVQTATLCLALYGVARLPPMPPAREPSRPTVRSILAGWGFVARPPPGTRRLLPR